METAPTPEVLRSQLAGLPRLSDDEAREALSTILEHEPTFQRVVDSVFSTMDHNSDGSLEPHEMGMFLARVCGQYGVTTPPNTSQVAHLFRHLDLDGDNDVSRDEMEAFLRHVFDEQLRKLTADFPGHLTGRTWPDLSGSTVTLPNPLHHVTLGYKESTDPGCPPELLVNVVLIPGSPGSRFFTHPSVRARGYLPGARLIVLERPGAFCTAMRIERVVLIGYSAGSPYALAAAALCREGLVERVALSGALCPWFPGIYQGMAPLFRVGYWACAHAHWFVRCVMTADGEAARRDARAALQSTFAPYVTASAGDAAAFGRPEVEAEFLEGLLETSSRGQEGTDVAESVRVAAQWGFEPACVKVPVCVWAGQQDAGTTIHMARHLAASLPHCELHELHGRGHLAFMDDDVMGEMAAWLGLDPSEGHAGPVKE
ncbi:hypothetical protein FOA52_002399 [Chlamydomonas sp. UWO 241]|nr:hypothetical protein FOA52_002399 [Chlamydomonas sp. UWO 241]